MKHSIKAFTLIELLVVIAIIAILAAILFPVFAQAKKSAKTAVTLSNLKQINLAFAMYANDYDDTFVLNDYNASGGDWDGGAWGTITTWPYLIQPYVKNTGIFYDGNRPGYPGPTSQGYPWDNATTIGLNNSGVAGHWTSPDCVTWPETATFVPGRVMSSQDSPAERMAAMPTVWGGTQVGWYYFEPYFASWVDMSQDYSSYSWWNEVWQSRLYSSGNTIPAAYLDGHVNKVKSGEFVPWTIGGRQQYCDAMTNANLFKFWGEWWSPS